MSASDHKQLDAQTDAHAHTCMPTCVSGAVLEGSQGCFVIESSLLWHAAYSCTVPHLLHSSFLSLAHLCIQCRAVISHSCIGSFGVASAWAWTICCISGVFLVVRHNPDSHGEFSGLRSNCSKPESDQEYHITEKTWWSFSFPMLITNSSVVTAIYSWVVKQHLTCA